MIGISSICREHEPVAEDLQELLPQQEAKGAHRQASRGLKLARAAAIEQQQRHAGEHERLAPEIRRARRP